MAQFELSCQINSQERDNISRKYFDSKSNFISTKSKKTSTTFIKCSWGIFSMIRLAIFAPKNDAGINIINTDKRYATKFIPRLQLF